MTRSKFIVVEHDAKRARLHFDLRFQMPKSSNWASFAVRKGIPTKPGLKHLAVRTHDHSRAEALFIGTIKTGYGAGRLKKWDDGSCIIHKYSPSHIAIEFKGRKIKGMYHLISTGVVDKNYKRQTYFLFKGKIVTEGTGMISRIPSGGLTDEVEEGQSELTSPDLFWDKTKRVVKNNKQIIETYGTTMMGMQGRNPPNDTQEVELDDEEADRQQTERLPWSTARKKIQAEQMIRRNHGTLHRAKWRLHLSEHNQLEESGMSSDQRKNGGREIL